MYSNYGDAFILLIEALIKLIGKKFFLILLF